jgi:hypothetical protein
MHFRTASSASRLNFATVVVVRATVVVVAAEVVLVDVLVLVDATTATVPLEPQPTRASRRKAARRFMSVTL